MFVDGYVLCRMERFSVPLALPVHFTTMAANKSTGRASGTQSRSTPTSAHQQSVRRWRDTPSRPFGTSAIDSDYDLGVFAFDFDDVGTSTDECIRHDRRRNSYSPPRLRFHSPWRRPRPLGAYIESLPDRSRSELALCALSFGRR